MKPPDLSEGYRAAGTAPEVWSVTARERRAALRRRAQRQQRIAAIVATVVLIALLVFTVLAA